MRRIALLALTAGALVLSAAGTAVAAPAGPEGPENCTFEKGITTCTLVGEPVITESTRFESCPEGSVGGGYVTTVTRTVTTTHSRHRGTYNSNGEEIDSSTSTSVSEEGMSEPPFCEVIEPPPGENEE